MTPLESHYDLSRSRLPYTPVLHRSNSNSSIGTGEGIKPPVPSPDILRGSPRYCMNFEQHLIQRIEKSTQDNPNITLEHIDLSRIPLQTINMDMNEKGYEFITIPGNQQFYPGITSSHPPTDNLYFKDLFNYIANDPTLPAAFRRICGGVKLGGHPGTMTVQSMRHLDARIRFIASILRASHNNAYKEQIEMCVNEAETNCGDRTAYFVESMYQISCIEQLSQSSDLQLQDLFNLGAAYFRLDRLRAVVADILSNNPKLPVVRESLYDLSRVKYGLAESLEIQLAVEHHLHDMLELPVNHANPTYGGYNVFNKHAMIRIAYIAEIETYRDGGTAFFEHMMQWDPWLQHFEKQPRLREPLSKLLESYTDKLEVVMEDDSLTMQQIKETSDQIMAEHKQAKFEFLKKETRSFLIEYRLGAYYSKYKCYPELVTKIAKEAETIAQIKEATMPLQMALSSHFTPMQVKMVRTMLKSDLPIVELGTTNSLNRNKLNPTSLPLVLEKLTYTHYGRAILIDFHELTDVDNFYSKTYPEYGKKDWYHDYEVTFRPLNLPGAKHESDALQTKKIISLYPRPSIITMPDGSIEKIHLKQSLFNVAKLAWEYASDTTDPANPKMGPIFNSKFTRADEPVHVAVRLYAELQKTTHTTTKRRQEFIADFIQQLAKNEVIDPDEYLEPNHRAYHELMAAFSDLELKGPVQLDANFNVINQKAPLKASPPNSNSVHFSHLDQVTQNSPPRHNGFAIKYEPTAQSTHLENPTFTQGHRKQLESRIESFPQLNQQTKTFIFELTSKRVVKSPSLDHNKQSTGYLLHQAFLDKQGPFTIGNKTFSHVSQEFKGNYRLYKATYTLNDSAKTPATREVIIDNCIAAINTEGRVVPERHLIWQNQHLDAMLKSLNHNGTIIFSTHNTLLRTKYSFIVSKMYEQLNNMKPEQMANSSLTEKELTDQAIEQTSLAFPNIKETIFQAQYEEFYKTARHFIETFNHKQSTPQATLISAEA